MRIKCGFSVTEEGVGGRAVVVPMARDCVGGSVGRNERMCAWGDVGAGKTYYEGALACWSALTTNQLGEAWLTI